MPTVREFAVARLHDKAFIPGRGIAVNILVIIVQAEKVALVHHTTRTVGKCPISAALGSGRQDVRVLIIVPAMNPAADREEHAVKLEVPLEVLSHLRGFLEGPVYAHSFLFGAVLVHAAVQSAPQ